MSFLADEPQLINWGGDHCTFILNMLSCLNREFKISRWRVSIENIKKPIDQLVKISKTTALLVPHIFLYISLPSLNDYNVNYLTFFMFYELHVHTTT